MKIIFGTTNNRKVEDLKNIIYKLNLNINVLGLSDIGWNRGEIEENGSSIEENSLIKANDILSFCKENNINYPILTDDAGLFVNALGGKPGIYTARYADDEININPTLPKYQCVIKLLNELNEEKDRSAYYRCCVTTMYSDGTYFQETGESRGFISNEIIGKLTKPYFYSVFILDGTNVAFNELKGEELENTYRYNALKLSLNKIKN